MIPTETTDSTINSQRTQAAPRFTMASSFWTIIRSFLSLEILRDPALAVTSVAHDAVEGELARWAGEAGEGPRLIAGRTAGVGPADASERTARHVPGHGRVLDVGRSAPLDGDGPVQITIVVGLPSQIAG